MVVQSNRHRLINTCVGGGGVLRDLILTYLYTGLEQKETGQILFLSYMEAGHRIF